MDAMKQANRSNKSLRNRQLAQIHIAKKQLGLGDGTYRTMLQQVAGVASAADLDEAGRKKVLAHFRKAGFRNYKNKRSYPGRPDIEGAKNRRRLLGKIEALLADARRPWKYAHNMAKQMFDVDRVQWCNRSQLHKLVGALEIDARRHGRR
jgi:phage gp16-like protein